MANVVVTSTASRIDVVFNDTSQPVGYSHASFPKAAMHRVSIDLVSDNVIVSMADGSSWRLGTNAIVVDSVDGTPTTDTASLYAAIKAMM